jgi:hypothetical protein
MSSRAGGQGPSGWLGLHAVPLGGPRSRRAAGVGVRARPPAGSRTPAWLEAHCCPGRTTVNRDPAGLRCPYWSRRRGLKRAQVKLYRAADCSASTPPAPRREWTGMCPRSQCERRGSGNSSGGLVRGGPLSRPLSYGVCGVTGSGRRGCRNGPRRREAERLGSGGLHGQAAPSAAVAGPHPHGLPADVLNAPRAAPGKLRTAGPAMPGDLAVAGQGADPTHEVGTVEIDAPHGVRLVSGPGSRRAPVVQAPSDALVTLKAS